MKSKLAGVEAREHITGDEALPSCIQVGHDFHRHTALGSLERANI